MRKKQVTSALPPVQIPIFPGLQQSLLGQGIQVDEIRVPRKGGEGLIGGVPVNERGISVLGDLPIYVSGDSADVWANQDQFQMDDQGRPTEVAGCPCQEVPLWASFRAMKRA